MNPHQARLILNCQERLPNYGHVQVMREKLFVDQEVASEKIHACHVLQVQFNDLQLCFVQNFSEFQLSLVVIVQRLG